MELQQPFNWTKNKYHNKVESIDAERPNNY